MSNFAAMLRATTRSVFSRDNRLSTIITIVILAASVTCATVVYSIGEAILLRPLPFATAGRLVSVVMVNTLHPSVLGELPTVDQYHSWAVRVRGFQALAAYSNLSLVLTETDRSAGRIQALRVTHNVFSVLGVHPRLGRAFVAREDSAGAEPVAILSDRFRVEHFGNDATVIGRRLVVDGVRVTVVGIMPASFRIPNSIPEIYKNQGEIWLPWGMALPTDRVRTNRPRYADVLGLRRVGVTNTVLDAELVGAISSSKALASGVVDRVAPRAVSVQRLTGEQVRKPLIMLSLAATMLILISYANVAFISLAAAVARRRDLAIRMALGATRGELLRELIFRGLVLAFPAGVGAALLSAWLLPTVVATAGPRFPDISISVGPFLVAVALGIAVIGGAVLGIVPALGVLATVSPGGLTNGSFGSGTGRGTRRLMGGLVVVEIALTIAVVSSMGATTRDFIRLIKTNPGFDVAKTSLISVTLPMAKYAEPAQRVRYASAVLSRIKQVPGVEDAAASSGAPYDGGSAGPVIAAAQLSDTARMNIWGISANYFAALGMVVRPGGGSVDQASAVMDSAAATRLFTHGGILGQRVTWAFGPDIRSSVVSGTVGDITEASIDLQANANVMRSTPHIYVPIEAASSRALRFIVRAQHPALVLASIRRAIAEVDRSVVINRASTYSTILGNRFARERFLVGLLIFMGVLTAALALSGAYSLSLYSITQRTREFSLRVALGAPPRHIFVLTLGGGARIVAMGVIAGTGIAFATRRTVQALVAGSSTIDATLLALVSGCLFALVLITMLIPAFRAMRADPIVVLREE